MSIPIQYVTALASVVFLLLYVLGYILATHTQFGHLGSLLFTVGIIYPIASVAILAVHLCYLFFQRDSEQAVFTRHALAAAVISCVLLCYYALISQGVFLSK